ncbi:MAG: YebC/PmpR family DNA-binding transcriptional regulator [Deltaproteobacteria bacterium]|nr:YebC/PmpR family DNA-binding transcriptional regulator [Deltaproteobacteria bacterium]
MSGHSKWAKIKRSKGAADKKRGKIFTRCIHEITVAVREGKSGDPDGNPRLRIAMDKARASNMPGDNIDRAIKRALGGDSDADRLEITYEGYGPGGAAVLVEVLTDNKNRTVSEVRHAFTRAGGSLGESGCVAYMFAKKGYLAILKENITEEKLYDVALEAGAGDIKDSGEIWEIFCEPGDFQNLELALKAITTVEESEIQMVANAEVQIAGKEAEQIVRLTESLEELDDVMNVWTNCDIADDGAAA